MWYDNNNNRKIEYNSPIFAILADKVYLLIPQHAENSYIAKGYDWFSIEEGRYNSCCCFTTVDEELSNFVHVLSLCNYSSIDSIKAMENDI